MSAQSWEISHKGQHIELGIAENNLFLLVAAMGLAHSLFGVRLLPIGTLYDPFICRGLDALNHACYQDSRFMLAGTPSGISLAPEGGAHQSIYTPLIGLGQAGLIAFEPAYGDELSIIMRWGFRHMQAHEGCSVYLRLSTRPVEQIERPLTPDLESGTVAGGYWLFEPGAASEISIVAMGATVTEAIAARTMLTEDLGDVGLLVVTSADLLMAGWHRRDGRSHAERLLARLPGDAGLVTVCDAHPATLSWIAAVGRHRVHALGVTDFGQSADIPDLFRLHGIDAAAIVEAASSLCLERAGLSSGRLHG